MTRHSVGIKFIEAVVDKLFLTSNLLALCLLLFVCFAAYPPGLSYRSRIFGINVGIIYFVVPEAGRRPLDLPSTSPFHRWNEILLAWGLCCDRI